MVGYFDLVPDPRTSAAQQWDAVVDAEEPDERDPLVLLRQEVQALYGEYLDRLARLDPNAVEHCAGCEVRRRYGWTPE